MYIFSWNTWMYENSLISCKFKFHIQSFYFLLFVMFSYFYFLFIFSIFSLYFCKIILLLAFVLNLKLFIIYIIVFWLWVFSSLWYILISSKSFYYYFAVKMLYFNNCFYPISYPLNFINLLFQSTYYMTIQCLFLFCFVLKDKLTKV